MNVEENSVVKVFLASEPQECNVKVNVNDAPDVEVAYDIITPVASFPASVSVFKGTLFTVTPSSGENVTVKAGETDVAPNEDGIYEIEIAADTEITVGKTSAIKSVVNEGADSNVYNMLGVKVGTSADFNRLPAGIYIHGGKKVIKK